MIREHADCQYTPPSLRHQDLKPRVNTASYKEGVLHWNTVTELWQKSDYNQNLLVNNRTYQKTQGSVLQRYYNSNITISEIWRVILIHRVL